MRDTWLVKNYRHVWRRTDPTANDIFTITPWVWVNTVSSVAYVLKEVAGVLSWVAKPPDRIISTPINNIYVIDTIAPWVAPVDTSLAFIDRDDFEFIDRDDFEFTDR